MSLRAQRGKPVVVNFWASWCVPCRKEMPAFAAVHASLGDKVAFVGVNNKDLRDSAIKFMDQTGVRYPSGFDPQGDVAARYGESRTGELIGDELQRTIHRLFGVA